MVRLIDDKLDLNVINGMLAAADPTKIVQWAFSYFDQDLILTSSFGADSAAFIHLTTQVAPDLRVVAVDTGYLFPETYQFMTRLEARFNLNLVIYRSLNDPWTYLENAGEKNPYWRRNVDACCAANKNEPFARAFNELRPKAWLRGTRRDQMPVRKNFKIIEWDSRFSAYAISPILNWNSCDVDVYMKQHELPYHPLYEKGFLSIGCNPLSCTRSVQQ